MGLGAANRVEVSRVDVHPRGRSLNGTFSLPVVNL